MIKRREPPPTFADIPCSIVAVGTALGRFPPAPSDLHTGGYLTLSGMNKYCRSLLPISKRVQFPRTHRPTLKEFLEGNAEKAIICVLGHFIYAEGNTYYSFLKNARDPAICVWYIK